MKIKLTTAEAEKIILKKIISLQKIKKEIRVGKNEKFISALFQLFKDIQDITMQESDYFEDNSQLAFSLTIYTNVNLSLFSNTIRGCNYGIRSFQIEKGKIVQAMDEQFSDIKNENELKDYFYQIDMILPNYIEIFQLDFTAIFEETTTYYNFLK